MPFPIAETIGAVATIAPTAINAASTGKTNRKTRAHQLYMFDRQREYALDDWHTMNEYNLPANQMQRFKDAGLNPALIYGTGATASDAGPIRNVEGGNWNPQAPQIEPGVLKETLGNIMQMKSQKLQLSLLQQNLRNEQEKEHLIEAQTSDTLASAQMKGQGVEKGAIDLETHKRLNNQDIPFSKALAEYQSISTDAELKHLDLEEKRNFQALAKSEQQARINEIEARIKNLGQENIINSVQEKLAKQGINPRSAGWMTEYWQQLRMFLKKL